VGSFPVWGGAIYRYSCVSPIKEGEAVEAAREIYFKKLQTFDSALFQSFDSVRCSDLKVEDDDFSGLRVGTEWSVSCSYIENNLAYDSASFRINKCRVSRLWEYGADFPNLVVEPNMREKITFE
jgi:hypothetical protein